MPQIELNSVSLDYHRQGAGETLLFIQGVGCKGCAWKPQTDRLETEFDCIRFDNRGIGNSLGDTTRLSIQQMADDAVGLLDALSIERAHIVGHSMGGVMAQELALRHRERVLSLSLICTLHRGKDALTPTFALLKNAVLTNIGTLAMKRRAFARMVSSPQYIAENGIESVVRELSDTFQRDIAEPPDVIGKQLRALSRLDSSRRLHELTSIPSMVLAGRYDPIGRPALARRLAAAIHAETLCIFEDSSHAMPIQSSRAVNRLLRQHVTQTSISTPG